MNVIHFGAGNIGRGFIGKLLVDAGCTVTFVDVNQKIIDAINKDKSYQVHIVGETQITEVVSGVHALNSGDVALLDLIVDCDLVTTAVGPNVLKLIAPTLAQGLQKRAKSTQNKSLNIIACENMLKGSSFFKEQVVDYLKNGLDQGLDQQTLTFIEAQVGFVDSAVDRIVPPSEDKSNILNVTVETFSEWIVDQNQFKGAIPAIKGMELTDNLLSFIERKLFTLNTGHIVTAYLGTLAHYKTIKEAIDDPLIYQDVKATMQESGQVLIQRYQFDPVKHEAYIEKILKRFQNPYLVDEIERVGREPIRKLGKNDRLIKPLLGTIDYHLPNDHLIKGIAAALYYVNEHDPQAVELQNYLSKNGVKETLVHYSGLDSNCVQLQQIEQIYLQLA